MLSEAGGHNAVPGSTTLGACGVGAGTVTGNALVDALRRLYVTVVQVLQQQHRHSNRGVRGSLLWTT